MIACLLLFFRKFFAQAHFADFSDVNIEIPAEYDFLKAYPHCDFGPTMQTCGCCYAYAALKAMSHRICRATGQKVQLSPQYIVNCDLLDSSCHGGNERSVLYFMEQHGIPDVECYPWDDQVSLNPTACHSCIVTTKKMKLYRAKPQSTKHYYGIETIKKAILLEGPLSASISTDEAFRSYKSGVYVSSIPKEELLCNHSLEIIGWGIDKDVPYWVAYNQFGAQWGEAGKMKIRMGTNEGLLEDFMSSAYPLLD